MTSFAIKFKDDTPDEVLRSVFTVQIKDGKIVFSVFNSKTLGRRRIEYELAKIAYLQFEPGEVNHGRRNPA